MYTQADKEKLQDNAANAEAMLKLLANKHRLMVLCSLVESEKSVAELEIQSGLSQSALSQHLAKLRHAGVISMRKEARSVYYKLRSVEVNAILTTLYLIYCN